MMELTGPNIDSRANQTSWNYDPPEKRTYTFQILQPILTIDLT